jgi:hypothetical protein
MSTPLNTSSDAIPNYSYVSFQDIEKKFRRLGMTQGDWVLTLKTINQSFASWVIYKPEGEQYKLQYVGFSRNPSSIFSYGSSVITHVIKAEDNTSLDWVKQQLTELYSQNNQPNQFGWVWGNRF